MLMKMRFVRVVHVAVMKVIYMPGMLYRLMTAISSLIMICVLIVDDFMSKSSASH